MTPEQRAAIVNAAVARALIRMEAMKALNAERLVDGWGPDRNEKDFLAIIDEEGIGYNAVIAALRD